MLNSNKDQKLDSTSVQYRWLDRELAKSSSQWKIVCHHHPVYSSWGPPTKLGINNFQRDTANTNHLRILYDRYHVDIVWAGHIHLYERTWPIKGGKKVPSNQGTIYMITRGGGAVLEKTVEFPPFFQNIVHYEHHYAWFESMEIA